jgi:hypothetical protein
MSSCLPSSIKNDTHETVPGHHPRKSNCCTCHCESGFSNCCLVYSITQTFFPESLLLQSSWQIESIASLAHLLPSAGRNIFWTFVNCDIRDKCLPVAAMQTITSFADASHLDMVLSICLTALLVFKALPLDSTDRSQIEVSGRMIGPLHSFEYVYMPYRLSSQSRRWLISILEQNIQDQVRSFTPQWTNIGRINWWEFRYWNLFIPCRSTSQ